MLCVFHSPATLRATDRTERSRPWAGFSRVTLLSRWSFCFTHDLLHVCDKLGVKLRSKQRPSFAKIISPGPHHHVVVPSLPLTQACVLALVCIEDVTRLQNRNQNRKQGQLLGVQPRLANVRIFLREVEPIKLGVFKAKRQVVNVTSIGFNIGISLTLLAVLSFLGNERDDGNWDADNRRDVRESLKEVFRFGSNHHGTPDARSRPNGWHHRREWSAAEFPSV